MGAPPHGRHGGGRAARGPPGCLLPPSRRHVPGGCLREWVFTCPSPRSTYGAATAWMLPCLGGLWDKGAAGRPLRRRTGLKGCMGGLAGPGILAGRTWSSCAKSSRRLLPRTGACSEPDKRGGQLAAASRRIAAPEDVLEERAGRAAEIKRREAVHAAEIAERDEMIKRIEADKAALAGDDKRLAASDACHNNPSPFPELPQVRPQLPPQNRGARNARVLRRACGIRPGKNRRSGSAAARSPALYGTSNLLLAGAARFFCARPQGGMPAQDSLGFMSKYIGTRPPSPPAPLRGSGAAAPPRPEGGVSENLAEPIFS